MKVPSPRRVFLFGMFFGMFANDMVWNFWFDLMGEERALRKLHESWIDSNTTMPIQIVAAVTVGMFVAGYWNRLPAGKPASN